MSCDEVREQLPDFTLGTLTEAEDDGVRQHLRGCGSCRAEAEKLDHGMALFASAAHEAEPPPELKDRVLRVISDEWRESAFPAISRTHRATRRGLWARPLLAAAAVVAIVAGALAWGVSSHIRANHVRADAQALRDFLDTLGGKDVRVGKLESRSTDSMQGSFVIYDGAAGEGQSWVLVLVRAPGYSGPANVALLGSNRSSITLRPIEVGQDGEGWTGLFANTDLSRFDSVRITSPSGTVLAWGRAIPRH